MHGLRETLFLLVVGMVVLAVAGDELVRVADSLVVPICVLAIAVVLARLAWSWTSRW